MNQERRAKMFPVINDLLSWYAIPWAERRDVMRRSRGREPLPDAETARLALVWARVAYVAVAFAQVYLVAVGSACVATVLRIIAIDARIVEVGLAAFVAAAALAFVALRPARVTAAAIRTLARRCDDGRDQDADRDRATIFARRPRRPAQTWTKYLVVAPLIYVDAVILVSHLIQLSFFTIVWWLPWVAGGFGACSAGVTVWGLARPQAPDGREPIAALDADGVHVPHLKVDAPWSAFTYADVGVHGRVVELRWYLREPAAFKAMTGLRYLKRRRAYNDVFRAGGAIALPTFWFAEPPEAVLRASLSYRADGVPA